MVTSQHIHFCNLQYIEIDKNVLQRIDKNVLQLIIYGNSCLNLFHPGSSLGRDWFLIFSRENSMSKWNKRRKNLSLRFLKDMKYHLETDLHLTCLTRRPWYAATPPRRNADRPILQCHSKDIWVTLWQYLCESKMKLGFSCGLTWTFIGCWLKNYGTIFGCFPLNYHRPSPFIPLSSISEISVFVTYFLK